jgi:hypothetical protein
LDFTATADFAPRAAKAPTQNVLAISYTRNLKIARANVRHAAEARAALTPTPKRATMGTSVCAMACVNKQASLKETI